MPTDDLLGLHQRRCASFSSGRKAHQEIAALHAEYADKLTDERKAEVKAAERPKYDPGRFQTAVSEAQARADEAAQHATSLEGQATAARQRWADSQRRLQAGGSNEAGSLGTGQ